MEYPIDIEKTVVINSLHDLPKLKKALNAMKIEPNISHIARELGCDRRTAKRYYNAELPKKTRNKPSYLDEYYDLIYDLLHNEASPSVFYYRSSLWRYLRREQIINCAESTFRRYILKHPELNEYFARPREQPSGPKGTVRFETMPGEQAQLDWKENISFQTIDDEVLQLNVLVLTLSYSRMKLYALTQSRSQDVLLAHLTSFFEVLGGVPHHIVCDNMSTIMKTARTEHGPGEVNIRFEQFRKDMGFTLRPCIAGRPQTKGKVESSMKLLDDIHAYQGKVTYEELQDIIRTLNREANFNINQGTRRIPIALFEKEKESLLKLPSNQIMTLYKITRQDAKVSKDGMVCYKRNHYSVPPEYVGKTVFLEVIGQSLHIYDSTTEICCHTLNDQRLNYLQDHYRQYLQKTQPYTNEIDERVERNLIAIGGYFDSNDP